MRAKFTKGGAENRTVDYLPDCLLKKSESGPSFGVITFF